MEQSSLAALAYCKGLVASLLDIIAAHNLKNRPHSDPLPQNKENTAAGGSKAAPDPSTSIDFEASTDALQNEGLVESEASIGAHLRISDTDVSAASLQTETEGATLETMLYASTLLWKMSASEEARETVAKIVEQRVDVFYGTLIQSGVE